jgi:hypothetical protein
MDEYDSTPIPETRTPQGPLAIMGRMIEEVGVENRGILQATMDENRNHYIVTQRPLEEGIAYIVAETKRRLPKAPPPRPQPGPMEDGFRFKDSEPPPTETFIDSVRARRAKRRGY